QASRFIAVSRQQQAFLECVDQRMRVQAEQRMQLAVAEQRLVAWRSVDLRGDGKQAAWGGGAVQGGQRTPVLECLGQACDAALAHLVAAGAAEQQGAQVNLLLAQALAIACQAVVNLNLLQAMLAGKAIQLVQLQPQPLGDRAVQLAGADQWAVQGMAGALQGYGQQLRAICDKVRQFLGDNQLVADR